MKKYVHSSIRLIIPAIVFSFIAISPLSLQAQMPVITNGKTLESPFAKVYEKLAPSIVRIDVIGEAPTPQRGQRRSPWDFFDERMAPQQQRQPRQMEGMGSGVIVDREGHILTNNHVISGADKISVKVSETEEYDADVVGKDPQTDLAVIKLRLDGKMLPESYVAELGDSNTLRPGDYAIAIGNPIGLERTITVGIISALGRYNLAQRGDNGIQFEDFIQTDAQINPGNSGGALADINGRVIGINDMYTANYAGIGFAIPINLARNVMTQIIATGDVKRGAVGIRIGEITKEFQEALDLPNREGVFVHEVIAGSPAEKAGMNDGDVIISLNGEKIINRNEFTLKVADLAPGTSIELGIIQNGKRKSITLELTNRDTIVQTESTSGWRGIDVVDINSALAEKYNIGTISNGVIVVNIDGESPAAETSLAEGDIIVEINYTPIKNVQDFIKVKESLENSTKPILIFKMRVTSNGSIEKKYVAVTAE